MRSILKNYRKNYDEGRSDGTRTGKECVAAYGRCYLSNQTGRKKGKKILPEFFKKFPDEFELLKSDKETIAEMLKDLGMKSVRANRIWRMTEDYLEWDGRDATELFGIGKYGSDSYEIFYRNKTPENVQDRELKRYLSDLECGKIKAIRRIL